MPQKAHLNGCKGYPPPKNGIFFYTFYSKMSFLLEISFSLASFSLTLCKLELDVLTSWLKLLSLPS